MKATYKEHVLVWCYTSLLLSQQDSPPEPLLRRQRQLSFRTSPPQYHTVCHQWQPCCPQLQERGRSSLLTGTACNSRAPIVLNALPTEFVCDNSCGNASGNQGPYQCRTACNITTFLEDNTRNATSRLPGRLFPTTLLHVLLFIRKELAFHIKCQ